MADTAHTVRAQAWGARRAGDGHDAAGLLGLELESVSRAAMVVQRELSISPNRTRITPLHGEKGNDKLHDPPAQRAFRHR